MRGISKFEKYALTVMAALVAAVLVSTIFIPAQQEDDTLREHIRAVLQLDEVPGRRSSLIVGYNYHLMREYAKGNGQTIEIRLSQEGESCIDSLKRGRIDMLALPMHMKGTIDSVLYSSNIDSLSVWVMRHEDHHDMKDVRWWLKQRKENDAYESTRDLFLKRFDPYRSRRREHLSPYDSIIKVHADSLDWDWRLLAAVVYQESRFHIEAQSHRGAAGIMQMMPRNIRRYGVTDPLDADQTIRAGAQMLKRLGGRYRNVSDDSKENLKFTLAAYNAGIGRMKNLIDYAGSKDRPVGNWDSLAVLISEMNEVMGADTSISYQRFKGSETISYVNNVLAVYEQFKRICPE